MAEPLPYAERLGLRLPPGTVLADRYRLESIVGAGAFGVVWRARHVHLETECAVKLFDPLPGADPQDASARFLQEARLTARLKCRYVAQVFDYGVHDRMPFLVLELLRGTSLADHLQALREQGRRLPPAETARIIRHVAEALHLAHAARVVHRDLKPENIFLVQEGESHVAKVLDFGIAKWSTDTAPSMTTTRTVMGTAHYMSAEQFESARQVDHRADLWSLGVIAFECLTGRVPFPGETFIEVAFRVCKEGPLVASQIAAVPVAFDAWFARATALGREYRFESALEQAQALERICSAAPTPAELPAPLLVPPESDRAALATAKPTRAIASSTLIRARAAAAFTHRLLHRTLVDRRRRWMSAVCVIGAVLLWALVLGFRSKGVAHPAGKPSGVAKQGAAEQDTRIPDAPQPATKAEAETGAGRAAPAAPPMSPAASNSSSSKSSASAVLAAPAVAPAPKLDAHPTIEPAAGSVAPDAEPLTAALRERVPLPSAPVSREPVTPQRKTSKVETALHSAKATARAARSPSSSSAAAAAAALMLDCRQPFWIDEKGIRRLKIACL